MFLRRLDDCETFVAGDSTILREILHPGRAPLQVRYSLAHAVVREGESSLRHRLTVSEVYYILEGRGRMAIDDERADVTAGTAVYIPPGATQWIENVGTGDLEFLCIVDPAWRPEQEKVLERR